MSPGVLAIVEDLADHPGSSIGDIARRTGLAQSLVSNTVAMLHERGVVAASRDDRDRRRTVVHITPDAKRSLIDPRGKRPVHPALRKVLTDHSEPQLHRIEKLLEELSSSVLPGR
jgi:DNA-binding MarR family transcriptional regulator